MVKLICLFFVTVLISVSADHHLEENGHIPGNYTMDLGAAKKYAKEKGLPILLNFTGSDWCGWCKRMERSVFTKPAWREFAKENLVMVWVDFPKDKSLVPQKYIARNNELRKKYSVGGYPTYIIIDAETDEVMGKLGAGVNKTPASFKAEVNEVTSMTESSVKKFSGSLSKEEGEKYLQMYKEIKQRKEALEKAKEQYNKLVKESNERIQLLKESMEVTRIGSKLTKEEKLDYIRLRKELTEAKKKVQSFLSSAPDNSKDNIKKFQDLNSFVREIEKKLSEY